MSYAATSAHRAATIATIARTRAASPAPIPNEGRAALTQIADLLDAAADAFRSSTPAVIDGITMNEIPAGAWFALEEAEKIAANTPAAGFPATLGQYVTRRQNIDLPPSLLPGGPVLIAQEGDLFARLLALHGHYLAVPDVQENPASVTAALEAAFTLHWKHARLAEAVAADAGRPYNQPAAEPAPTAEPAPLDLTGLTAYTIGIIRLAESKGFRATDGGTYRGVRRISLDAGGKHGTFGTIQVGASSGRALRAELIHGNGGIKRRAHGALAVRAMVKNEPAHACPDGCTAPSLAHCHR